MYQFVLAIVLGLYVGFSRLNQLRYIARDPLLAGIVKAAQLPPQSTLWRFLNSLHVGIAPQILAIQRKMREAVWAAGNIVLESVTIDTDTTVHTLYGKQMGARKSYNPKNKGKKAINRSCRSWRKPRNSSAANCATAIGRQGSRLHGIFRMFFKRCLLRGVDFRPRGFRLLLLGSGGSIRKVQVPSSSS